MKNFPRYITHFLATFPCEDSFCPTYRDIVLTLIPFNRAVITPNHRRLLPPPLVEYSSVLNDLYRNCLDLRTFEFPVLMEAVVGGLEDPTLQCVLINIIIAF